MKFWRKLNKGCLLLIAIPFVILFGLLLFAQWAWGGHERTTIPNELVPTAEYLMKQPIAEPNPIQVFPRPASVVKPSERATVCLGYVPQPQDDDREKLKATYNWTRVYLNGERLPQSEISGSIVGTITRACLEIGYNFNLSPGLHLFRIQIASSFNEFLTPDPKLSYEWAYRVE